MLHFPSAVSFIIKKNVHAYILRLDYLLCDRVTLYARATLYARLQCGPTFRSPSRGPIDVYIRS